MLYKVCFALVKSTRLLLQSNLIIFNVRMKHRDDFASLTRRRSGRGDEALRKGWMRSNLKLPLILGLILSTPDIHADLL